VEAAVLDATLEKLHGKIEDKETFMKTVRAIKVDTARGRSPSTSGHVVGKISISARSRRKGRALVNRVNLDRAHRLT